MRRKLFFSFFLYFIFLFSAVAPVFAEEKITEDSVKNKGCKQTTGSYTQSALGLNILPGQGIVGQQLGKAIFGNFYICDDGKGYKCRGGSCSPHDFSSYVCTTSFSLAGCLNLIANWTVYYIFWVINYILETILGFASWILDIVIYTTVVKFRSNFVDLNLGVQGGTTFTGDRSFSLGSTLFGTGKEDLIYYLWGMLRDFVNILLFITIMYYAVKTMFEGFDEQRKKFIYLLIFSIVINFSLFFIKFAIDISNILTLQTYTLTVDPAGFDTFEQFRKRPGNSLAPATIGEYLVNLPKTGELVSPKTGEKTAAQLIQEGQRKTWVFQLGLMIVYIGFIYMIFYMIGFLVLRAFAFLLAMILAALLAADIFFSTVAGDKDGKTYEFASKIRDLTDRIRDDFYDALLKGPILFLFLFLIGILANAVFNQQISQEVLGLAKQSSEFGALGQSFRDSVHVFIKFAVFFSFMYVLFEKLKVLQFRKKDSWLAKYSSKGIAYATKGIGLGSRMVGYAGQNTIGRWASNRDGRLGRALNNINNSKFVQNWKNADGGTIRGRLQRRVGGAIAGSIKGVKEGNYDVVGTARSGFKKIDEKVGGRIANAISQVTFNTSDASDFGPGITTTREQRDQAAADERKKKRDAELAATDHSNVVTAEDYLNASRGVKIKDAGDVTLEALENFLSNKDTPLRGSATETFVNAYRSGDAKVRLQVKEARDKADSKATEAAHHRDEHTKDDIQKEYLTGKRRAESYAGIAKDIGSLRGLDDQRSQLELDSAKLIAGGKATKAEADAAKKNKEAREFASKVTAVADFISETDSALSEIKTALDLDEKKIIVLSDDERKGLRELESELNTAKSELPSGKIDADKIKSFTNNSPLHDKVYAAKRKAAEQLMGIFDKGTATVKALTDARKEAAISYNAINKSEPTAPSSTLRSMRSTTGPTEADRRAHERRVVEAKERLDTIDRALSTAYANAQKIEQRIGPSIEKLEKLKAKPEEKK